MSGCMGRYVGLLKSAVTSAAGRFALSSLSTLLIPVVILAAVGALIFGSPPSGLGVAEEGAALAVSFPGEENPTLLLGWPEFALLVVLSLTLGLYSAVERSLGKLGVSSASVGVASAVTVTTCCTVAPAPLVSFAGAAAASVSSAALAYGIRALGLATMTGATAYYAYRVYRGVKKASEPLCSGLSRWMTAGTR